MMTLGIELEKYYGTLMFAVLNFWLMIISQALDLSWSYLMVYAVPDIFGGSQITYLSSLSIGYSNILFGILMLFALSGDPYTSYFGCRFRKVYTPFILLIATRILIPNTAFTGHLFGIIAALILQFCGCY